MANKRTNSTDATPRERYRSTRQFPASLNLCINSDSGAIEGGTTAMRTRGHFLSDDTASKLLYLVLKHAFSRWKSQPRDSASFRVSC